MYSKVYCIIEDLGSITSKNEKIKILERNKNVPLLKEFFSACLDPFETYFIKKIPEYVGNENPTMTFDEALVLLKQFSSRKLTGNAAIDELQSILSSVHFLDAKLIELIIKKDPDCGCQRTTINSIWPKLIHEFPVLLCSAYDVKLINKLNWKNGVIVQLKSDGARCNIVIDEFGGVSLFSRQGRPIDTKGRFDYLGEKFKSVMLDGELLVRDVNGNPMSRKEGNGRINKAIKGTISDKEASLLYLMAWDVISLEDFKKEECNIPYKTRLQNLNEFIDNEGIVKITTDIVFNIDQAMEIYYRYLEQGEEGAILKDMDLPWSNKRSKLAIKLKSEIDCDLEVIDYKEGTGKHLGKMGALLCKTRDGKIVVSVGGGFSDAQRAQIKADYLNIEVVYYTVNDGVMLKKIAKPSGDKVLGRIMSVTYNAKIESEGNWSLFLPRATTGEFRLDKDIADSFDEVK